MSPDPWVNPFSAGTAGELTQSPGGESVVVPFPDAGGATSQSSDAIYGDKALIERYGEPVYFGRTKDGANCVTKINQAYWAALYAQDNTILYDPGEKCFYQYQTETGLYKVISPDKIKQSISEQMLEYSRQDFELGSLEKLRDDRNLNAIVGQLRGIVEQRDAFSNRPHAIHLSNGMLLAFDGILRIPGAFSPTFRSRAQSPIKFLETAKCPRFLDELLNPAVSRDDQVILQKMAGQFLLGRNLIQRFLVTDGMAGGGKSQLAAVVQGVVGASNIVQLRTDQLHSRFETSRYLGRSLLVGVDVAANFLSTSGANAIKGLVGGDQQDAERKNGNGVHQFKGNLNILITANTRLKIRFQGDVGAWRRRLLIVRFEGRAPAKKIPNFGELLIREEGPGILNWCLDGLDMLLADIRDIGDIRLADTQRDRVESLLEESDSVRIFLSEQVERTLRSDVTVNELELAYAAFCGDRGWDPLPSTQLQRALPDLMRELFQVVRSNDCRRNGKYARGYHNVTLAARDTST